MNENVVIIFFFYWPCVTIWGNFPTNRTNNNILFDNWINGLKTVGPEDGTNANVNINKIGFYTTTTGCDHKQLHIDAYKHTHTKQP